MSRYDDDAKSTVSSYHTAESYLPPHEPDFNDDKLSESSTTVEEVVYPKGLQLIAIVIALCLAVLLVAIDQTIVATAIPRITDRFGSVGDIGWYGSVRPLYCVF